MYQILVFSHFTIFIQKNVNFTLDWFQNYNTHPSQNDVVFGLGECCNFRIQNIVILESRIKLVFKLEIKLIFFYMERKKWENTKFWYI